MESNIIPFPGMLERRQMRYKKSRRPSQLTKWEKANDFMMKNWWIPWMFSIMGLSFSVIRLAIQVVTLGN